LGGCGPCLEPADERGQPVAEHPGQERAVALLGFRGGVVGPRLAFCGPLEAGEVKVQANRAAAVDRLVRRPGRVVGAVEGESADEEPLVEIDGLGVCLSVGRAGAAVAVGGDPFLAGREAGRPGLGDSPGVGGGEGFGAGDAEGAVLGQPGRSPDPGGQLGDAFAGPEPFEELLAGVGPEFVADADEAVAGLGEVCLGECALAWDRLDDVGHGRPLKSRA
jgi:hypothetical protein